MVTIGNWKWKKMIKETNEVCSCTYSCTHKDVAQLLSFPQEIEKRNTKLNLVLDKAKFKKFVVLLDKLQPNHAQN